MSFDEAALARRFLPVAKVFFLRHGRAHDADDLAHEALVVAIEALRKDRVRDPERVGGFLLGVCRNLVRTESRRESRRAAAFARVDREGCVVPEENAPDGFKLLRCLNALSARARDVVVRSYVMDEDAETVANDHGITLGNLRVLRHRALGALFRCLEEGGT